MIHPIHKKWCESKEPRRNTGIIISSGDIKELLDYYENNRCPLTEKEFVARVAKKYPHAYSLAPKELWEWIYRNINTLQNIK